MTVETPLPFEVEKKALRPSGSKSFFRGKAPSIVRPSYSVQSSIDKFQSWERVQDRRPRRANPTLRASNDAEWKPGHARALRWAVASTSIIIHRSGAPIVQDNDPA